MLLVIAYLFVWGFLLRFLQRSLWLEPTGVGSQPLLVLTITLTIVVPMILIMYPHKIGFRIKKVLRFLWWLSIGILVVIFSFKRVPAGCNKIVNQVGFTCAVYLTKTQGYNYFLTDEGVCTKYGYFRAESFQKYLITQKRVKGRYGYYPKTKFNKSSCRLSSPFVSFLDSIFRVRKNFLNQVYSRLQRDLGDYSASLFLALVFGVSTKYLEEIEDIAKDKGVSHVLVVSGYNLVIVLNVLGILLKFVNKRAKIILETLALVMFLVLTGLQPPIIRAFFSKIVEEISAFLGIEVERSAKVIIALLLITYFFPYIIFSISFQLSMWAWILVMWVVPKVKEFVVKVFFSLKDFIIESATVCLFRYKRTPKVFVSKHTPGGIPSGSFTKVKFGIKFFIEEYILTNAIVTLGMIPLLFYYFKTANLSGLFYGILVLPLIDIITPVAYYGLFLLFIPLIKNIYLFIVQILLELLLVVLGGEGISGFRD